MSDHDSARARVERELTALYRSAELATEGVLHSVHAVRAPGGKLHALRIDEHAPRSDTDWFVLSLCRARADAVLTSAENVRREPALSHRQSGAWADTLSAYRERALGKSEPLTCAILTRRGELPLTHPVWSDGTRKLLLTVPEQEGLVRRRFGHLAEVVGVEELDAARAVELLVRRGSALISVEAGPSTAAGLYRAPSRISELWLTRWEMAPADAALAGPLPDDAELFRDLRLVGASEREEHGQRFRFEQWRRR